MVMLDCPTVCSTSFLMSEIEINHALLIQWITDHHSKNPGQNTDSCIYVYTLNGSLNRESGYSLAITIQTINVRLVF